MFSTLVVFALGYVVAKIFPIPGLDSRIIAGWAKLWDWMKSKF